MLRVTIKTDGRSEIWELEGKLSGEWVGELERLWRTRSSRSGVTTEIHLKAVSYIDPAGKQVLTEMRAQGAEIKGCGCMIRAVIEKIMGKKDAQDASGSTNKSLPLILMAGFLFGGAILRARQSQPVALLGGTNACSSQVGSRFGNQFHNDCKYLSFPGIGVCIPNYADDVLTEERAAG